jgi:membrane protease YdiL (CAAX protease family)
MDAASTSVEDRRMRARPPGWTRVVVLATALSAVLAAWNDVVVTRVPGYPGSYVPVNTTATGVALIAARRAGLTWSELGLSRRRLRAGLRLGGAGVALVTAAYGTALGVPALRPLLRDARVEGLDGADLARQVLVRIPLGTVLWEEVAFRGVLLAALLRLVPQGAAVTASSALFGVWHVRPTLEALAANDLGRGPVRTGAAVALACCGTAVGGALFAQMRTRSGSLVAPLLLHLAANALGTLAAAAAFRLGEGAVTRVSDVPPPTRP